MPVDLIVFAVVGGAQTVYLRFPLARECQACPYKGGYKVNPPHTSMILQ